MMHRTRASSRHRGGRVIRSRSRCIMRYCIVFVVVIWLVWLCVIISQFSTQHLTQHNAQHNTQSHQKEKLRHEAQRNPEVASHFEFYNSDDRDDEKVWVGVHQDVDFNTELAIPKICSGKLYFCEQMAETAVPGELIGVENQLSQDAQDNVDECCTSCADISDCSAFTYQKENCLLFSTTSATQKNTITEKNAILEKNTIPEKNTIQEDLVIGDDVGETKDAPEEESSLTSAEDATQYSSDDDDDEIVVDLDQPDNEVEIETTADNTIESEVENEDDIEIDDTVQQTEDQDDDAIEIDETISIDEDDQPSEEDNVDSVIDNSKEDVLTEVDGNEVQQDTMEIEEGIFDSGFTNNLAIGIDSLKSGSFLQGFNPEQANEEEEEEEKEKEQENEFEEKPMSHAEEEKLTKAPLNTFLPIGDYHRQIKDEFYSSKFKFFYRFRTGRDINELQNEIFHHYSQKKKRLKILHFPIGMSGDKNKPRNIKVLQLGNPTRGRNVFVIGALRGCEWVPPMAILHTVMALIGRGEATLPILDAVRFHFIAVPNPDGYEYSHRRTPSSARHFCKNRRVAFGSHGVDLERNWGLDGISWGFGKQGKEGAKKADFQGPANFSEPETRTLRDYMKHFTTGVGRSALLHVRCCSGTVTPPQLYRKDLVERTNVVKVAELFTKAVTQESSKYTVTKRDAEFSSKNTGSMIDWAHSEAKIEHAYTFEIKSSGLTTRANHMMVSEEPFLLLSQELERAVVLLAQILLSAKMEGTAVNSNFKPDRKNILSPSASSQTSSSSKSKKSKHK